MPSCEHEAGISSDQWFGVGMKIAEHGVATPAPDDTDFVRVKASKEEGHGPACSKGAGSDIGWVDSGVAWYGEGRDAEYARDHGGGDGAFFASLVEVDVERCGRRSIVLLEVGDTSECGTYGARDGMSGGAVGQLFPFDSIFLGGECEASEGGHGELVECSEMCMFEVAGTDLHANILEAKRVFGITRSVGIFARS